MLENLIDDMKSLFDFKNETDPMENMMPGMKTQGGLYGFKQAVKEEYITATDIDVPKVSGEKQKTENYYDLGGRLVTNPKEGQLYIHNGKKVVYNK